MLWDKELKIKQLDETFASFKPIKNIRKPHMGWLKLIRAALGMSARALGQRVGLSQSRIALIEKGEVDGSTTLNTMEKVAEGLNCEFVYFILPKGDSLKGLREQQAYKKAQALDHYIERQMCLEEQATSKNFQAKNIQELAEEYLKKWPRDFWDNV